MTEEEEARPDDVEASYRAFVACINAKEWEDVPRYMHSRFVKGDQEFTPETYVASMQNVVAQVTVDSVTRDTSATDRLASTMLVRYWPPPKPTAGGGGGAEDGEKGKERGLEEPVVFREHHFNWFTEGKFSRAVILADREEVRRQLGRRDSDYRPDLVSLQEGDVDSSGALSRDELEGRYRAYIKCINDRTMAPSLSQYCHPQVIHNGKELDLMDEYRILMEDAIAAIPDIHFGIDDLVVDDKAQRVAARLKFTGTPVKTFAGVEATGKDVVFHEHALYQFRRGQIARVWSLVDLVSYREQLSRKT